MTTQFITYFGYGSLVNRKTRPSAELALPTSLQGWRRAWAHHSVGAHGNCCSLTVEAAAKSDTIDGVLVTMPVGHLPDLDARERGYRRVMVPAESFAVVPDHCANSVAVYVSEDQHNRDATTTHPILQSYVDCVLDGFAALFGDTGLNAFMHSTRGWSGPIEDDRHSPRYPRAVELPDQRLQTFDEMIAGHRLP